MSRPTRMALAGLAALAVAMGIGRFAFTPLLPMMQADAGLGLVEGGWLASANYIGYLAGALTAVALRIAPRTAIRASLVAVGLATLAMGHTYDLAAWLGLRFIAGLASAWVLVFASAWCLEWFQAEARNQAPALGATLFSGVGVGIAVAGSLCLAVITAGRPSADAWTFLGIIALAAPLILPRDFGVATAKVSVAPASGRFPAGSARLIACYGAFGFGYIIPATFISAMARDASRDPTVYGWSWPIFGITAAASTFLAAWARSRSSDRRLWMTAQAAMAVGVVAPLVLHGLGGVLVSALLVGGTFMVVTMVGMQEARRIAGSAARPLMAAMTAAFAAGQVAGPLAVSALAAMGGSYDAALLVAGGLLMVSVAALAFQPLREVQ